MTLHLLDDKTAPKSQRFRWQLKSKNGRIVAASSEGFATRDGCKENVGLTFQGLNEKLHYTGASSSDGSPFDVSFDRPSRKVSK